MGALIRRRNVALMAGSGDIPPMHRTPSDLSSSAPTGNLRSLETIGRQTIRLSSRSERGRWLRPAIGPGNVPDTKQVSSHEHSTRKTLAGSSTIATRRARATPRTTFGRLIRRCMGAVPSGLRPAAAIHDRMFTQGPIRVAFGRYIAVPRARGAPPVPFTLRERQYADGTAPRKTSGSTSGAVSPARGKGEPPSRTRNTQDGTRDTEHREAPRPGPDGALIK